MKSEEKMVVLERNSDEGMETLSALLVSSVGNPPFASGFPSHRFSNATLWFFANLTKLFKYTFKWSMISNDTCHCDTELVIYSIQLI